MSRRPAVISEHSTLKKLPVVVEVMEHRHNDDLHWHDYVQVWYVLRGTLRHTIEDKVYTQNPGACAIILPFVAHNVDTTASEDDPYILSLSFTDRFLLDYGYNFFSYANSRAQFEGFSIPTYCELSEEHQKNADELANAMVKEFSRHHDMSFDVLAHLCADFLRIFCTEHSADTSKGFTCTAERAKGITQAIRYMSDHLSEKISLDDLCSVAMMSRCGFTKNFKAVTGMTSMEFLLSLRLQHAQLMILFTDKTLSEIAREVCLYDSARLIHEFIKRYGMSPTKYREMRQKTALAQDAMIKKRWEWLNKE